MLSSGWFPGVWNLYVNVLEHSAPSSYLPVYEDGTDSVLKHWHIKFRCQGITQKSAYNIQNTAKVWNKELLKIVLQLDDILLNTLYTSVVTDSKSKHEGRGGKRHRKVYTYIVLLYGKWSLCHYFHIYGFISLCQFLPYIQKNMAVLVDS